jgi:hypothetical protein
VAEARTSHQDLGQDDRRHGRHFRGRLFRGRDADGAHQKGRLVSNARQASDGMLYEPPRHEALRPIRWNEGAARQAIERIVADTEARFSTERYWPLHPLDAQSIHQPGRFETSLYAGACGVLWALHYLEAVGACTLSRRHGESLERLLGDNRRALGASAESYRASFLRGDTPIRMMAFGAAPTAECAAALADLILGNVDHPARELLLGSPGTLLAALHLHEHTEDERWGNLFRLTADKLWSQLEWSSQHRCAYWTQHLYGRKSTYLDAVHGFVATALPLIRGRHLLGHRRWDEWERTIVNTVERTADRVGEQANWRPELLDTRPEQKKLVQFCHGAPGFIICLADLPDVALDDLLVAAGETVWAAGPLIKGSNLCHGTGGNGYALLKLHRRTRDSLWLDRARSFAMPGIAQNEEAASRYGQSRYNLWTGDLGLAI